MEIEKSKFEAVLDEYKQKKGVKFDKDLDAETSSASSPASRKSTKKAKGVEFPAGPARAADEAVKAVFRSWDNPAPSTTAA